MGAIVLLGETYELSILEQATRIPIAHLRPHSGSLSVMFKVLYVKEPRQVLVKRTGLLHLVAEATVADSTAKITLTLWDSDIDEVTKGRTYILHNGRVSFYDESMTLTRGFSGEFILSPEHLMEVCDCIDMSRPFAAKPTSRTRQRSERGRNFDGVAGREARGFCSKKSF